MQRRQVLWDPTLVPTFWINHASRLLIRRFDERLRPLGFSMANLHVAFTIEEHGPLQQAELLRFIHVEQPTMVAMIKRMERDGLVLRKQDPKDSRARLLSLTPRAIRTLASAREALAGAVDDALAGVPEDDRAALTKTLQTIVSNLSSDTPSPTGPAIIG